MGLPDWRVGECIYGTFQFPLDTYTAIRKRISIPVPGSNLDLYLLGLLDEQACASRAGRKTVKADQLLCLRKLR